MARYPLIFLLIASACWGCTPRTGYSFCATLTQVHTQVGGSDSTDFPVGMIGVANGSSGTGAFTGSNVDLRTAANGGKIQNVIAVGGIIQATYTSGGTLSGTGTCTLTSFSNATGATANIAVTAGVGGIVTMTAPGSGATTGLWSATLGNGTATCSGTASGDGSVNLTPASIPADIVVTSDSGGTTPIPFEIASYTAATGQIELYLKETISHTVDTLAYVSFDNASQTTYANQGQLANTWNSGFVTVQHSDLTSVTGGGSTTNSFDSTGNDVTVSSGAPFPTQVAGVAGHAWKFSGSNSFSQAAAPPAGLFPTGSNVRTSEVWFNRNGSASSGVVEGGDAWGSSNANHAWITPQTCDAATCGTPVYDAAGIGVFGNGCWISVAPATDSNWHYSVSVLPSGTTVASILLYYDGALQTITCGNGGATINTDDPNNGANPWTIGKGPTQNWHQSLDEIRVSNVARSADWITATYNNLHSPGSFLTVGNAASAFNPPGQVIIF